FASLFSDTATTESYTLSLHDALPILPALVNGAARDPAEHGGAGDAEIDPERSEEHTSELQSLAYLVCRLLLAHKKTPDRPVAATTHPMPTAEAIQGTGMS